MRLAAWRAGSRQRHLILGHADRVLDAAQDDGAVAGEPLDQPVSLSATTTVLTTRGEVRFLGPNAVPRAPPPPLTRVSACKRRGVRPFPDVARVSHATRNIDDNDMRIDGND